MILVKSIFMQDTQYEGKPGFNVILYNFSSYIRYNS